MQQADETLVGSHVVIVGGSSGMGLALAGRAARAGARLTLMARDPDKLASAARAVGGADVRVLDLRREATVLAACEDVGAVDHLVVTAGEYRPATFAETGPEEWRGMLEERLIGPLLLVRRLGPTTSIVLVSGTVSRRILPGSTWATIALSGVEAAVRALAVELAPVRVNGIVPGAVDTPLLARGRTGAEREDLKASIAARLPAKRVGAPEDIAQTGMFLLTNPFITGETILVDGGAVLV